VFSDEHGFAHVVSDNDDDLAGSDDLTIPTAVLSSDRPM
jgi:hypothetical protein